MRRVLSRTFSAVFSEMEPYFADATPRTFKRVYNSFLAEFPGECEKIDSYKSDGVGPGELIAYFIFNNITIGGGSSPIDLFLDGEPFAEVKAGDGSGDRVQDFKLDTEHSKSSKILLKNLGDFNDEYRRLTGEDLPNWNGAGDAATTALRQWRGVDLAALGSEDDDLNTIDDIEDNWVAAILDAYVRDKYFMLVNRKTLRVNYFGQLGVEMVDLLRTTRGQPKAAVSP